jgi:DNA-binding phage protein
MSVFKTNFDQKVRVYEIAALMKKRGLSANFIVSCVDHSLVNEGSHDLMVLWSEATNEKERNEVIADLQDEIELSIESRKYSLKKPYIKYDDLEAIGEDVLKYKRALRKIVDKHGGIGKLAEKSGIPQPSLSRFFNSASLPRRATLYKIAEALQLNEKDLLKEWVT